MIAVYQPCAPGRRTTRGKMVCNQHRWYFEACREIRNPRAMLKSDLLSLLRRWKAAGDDSLLMGDFNENVHTGNFAIDLAGDKFQMSEMLDYRDFAPSYARPCKYPPLHSVRHRWPLLLFRGSSPREGGSWRPPSIHRRYFFQNNFRQCLSKSDPHS